MSPYPNTFANFPAQMPAYAQACIPAHLPAPGRATGAFEARLAAQIDTLAALAQLCELGLRLTRRLLDEAVDATGQPPVPDAPLGPSGVVIRGMPPAGGHLHAVQARSMRALTALEARMGSAPIAIPMTGARTTARRAR